MLQRHASHAQRSAKPAPAAVCAGRSSLGISQDTLFIFAGGVHAPSPAASPAGPPRSWATGKCAWIKCRADSRQGETLLHSSPGLSLIASAAA